MKTRIDSRLREEAKKFRLQFSCPDCVHHDLENDRCSEGYPNDEHRDGSLKGTEVLFCKLFEGA